MAVEVVCNHSDVLGLICLANCGLWLVACVASYGAVLLRNENTHDMEQTTGAVLWCLFPATSSSRAGNKPKLLNWRGRRRPWSEKNSDSFNGKEHTLLRSSGRWRAERLGFECSALRGII